MNDTELVEAYRRMLLIRRFEERVADLYRDARIPGFVHVSIGQESAAVGVCMALNEDDYLTTTHRGHGHCLARGMSPDAMMAELFGRQDGSSSGLGGSMHIADPTLGILGANGVVGAGLAIAVGAGVSCKAAGKGVAVAFFGEGAATTGIFHESVNLACVWDLPVLFVCENNGYAEFSPWGTLSRAATVAELAAGYGIDATIVDAADVETVHAAANGIIARIRKGDARPALLELQTYRIHGHYEGDPEIYRPEEEVEAAVQRDALRALRHRLVRDQIVPDDRLRSVEMSVTAEVNAAVDYAEASPYPSALP